MPACRLKGGADAQLEKKRICCKFSERHFYLPFVLVHFYIVFKSKTGSVVPLAHLVDVFGTHFETQCNQDLTLHWKADLSLYDKWTNFSCF